MKLVVDNPTQGPAKRAGKAHGASPFLNIKLTGESRVKNSVVRDFQQFLEARVSARAGTTGKNGSDSKELQEQPSEQTERNYLDTIPFGNLFDDLERKYERDLKEAAPVEFNKPHGFLVQDMKLIDARTLFANLRIEHEHSGLPSDVMQGSKASSAGVTRSGSVEALAVATSPLGEKGGTGEKRNIGVEKHARLVPEGLQAGALTPQNSFGTQAQPHIAGFLAEHTESEDFVTTTKLAATQVKPAEADSSHDASASRLEVLPTQAAMPGPLHQIIERVTKMLPAQSLEIRHPTDGQKTVRFALQPENLGDLSLVLRLRDSGIDLAIRPERLETKQYLEDSKDELLQSLKLAGVDLGNVEIKPPDATASQDGRQDKPGAGQGGGHTSHFQSQHGGSPFNGGNKENQWRMTDFAVERKGEKDETEQPETGSSAVGRGIVL